MTRFLYFKLTTAAFLLATSTMVAQTWTPKKSAPGIAKARDGGVSFELNGKVYTGGGFYSKDFIEYNPTADDWVVKADIPGTINSRMSAIAFSVNGKGYVALGSDIDPGTFTGTEMKDVWEYNGTTWTKKADFPGSPRAFSACFVINGKAYVVGGFDNNNQMLKETWEYDPSMDKWAKKADFPMDNINGASGFAINGKGYVALGTTKSGSAPATYNNTLYEYNPSGNSWTKKADFPGTGRASATAFVLGSTGFVGQGSSLSGMSYVYHNDFYTYNPATNTWGAAINNFPGSPRQHLVSAVAGGKAYVGQGWTFISGNNTYYKDWYEFKHPLSITMPDPGTAIRIYPNPSSGILHVDAENGNDKIEYAVYNITGQKLLSGTVEHKTIHTGSLSAGTYVLELVETGGASRRLITIL